MAAFIYYCAFAFLFFALLFGTVAGIALIIKFIFKK